MRDIDALAAALHERVEYAMTITSDPFTRRENVHSAIDLALEEAALRAGGSLDELRALSDKATPGPWLTWHGDDSYCMNCYGITTGPCDHEYVDDDGHAQHTVALTLLQQPRYASLPDDWDANASFIVAAVNYVRSLLRGPQATEPTGSASSIDLREGEKD